jgi:hypothetical protein
MPLDSLELRTSPPRALVGQILILVPLTEFDFNVGLQGDSRQMAGENIRSVTRTAYGSCIACGNWRILKRSRKTRPAAAWRGIGYGRWAWV